MKSLGFRLVLLAAIAGFTFGLAQAGTLHGTVKNGTTGQPAAGIEVILLQLQGGMQPVANSKSDAQGQFKFDDPSLGAQPMLVRAVYHGVNFHQPVPPGTSEVQVEVFDTTTDAKAISVPSRIVIFQPDGASLIVGEEYAVQNHSQPPRAFFKPGGNFDFVLPDQADLQQAAAWGPSGMPVVQATIDRGKNRYAVAFAFRPGESGVRYSYKLPYPGNATTVKLPPVYAGGRLVVVAPPTVKVNAEGFEAAGQEQGMNLYARDNVNPAKEIIVNLSGTAPPPSSGGGQDAGGRDAQDAQAGQSGATIQAIPGRLDALKWPLIAALTGMFALGGILLARKPVTVVASADSAAAVLPAASIGNPPAASGVGASSPASALTQMDAAVNTSLDSLKDTLFRLELRRQAGTITEEEYARERARAEKVLRDLLRG